MEDLIYLYGLVPSNALTDTPLPKYEGFDGESELFTIPVGATSAVVCRLDSETYSEDKLKDLIENDMGWLQEKAFHHHETVVKLARELTTLPLKFCTLYKSESSLKSTIESNQDKLQDTFALLKGKEEWNLKVYCDDTQLKEEVSSSNPVVLEKLEEISQLSKGKQFFEKKKIEKLINDEVETEKDRISEEIHEALKVYVEKGDIKRNWSQEVTGRQENMTWNGVYLIAEENVEAFLQKIKDFGEEMQEAGWSFEPTGPWPAYHFSSFQ